MFISLTKISNFQLVSTNNRIYSKYGWEMHVIVIVIDEIVITKTTIQYKLHTQAKNSSIQWAPGMIDKLFSQYIRRETFNKK